MDGIDDHLPEIAWAIFAVIGMAASLGAWLQRRGSQGWPQVEAEISGFEIPAIMSISAITAILGTPICP